MLSNKELLIIARQLIISGGWDFSNPNDPVDTASESLTEQSTADRIIATHEVKIKLNKISIDYYDQSWNTISRSLDNEYPLYVIEIAIEEEDKYNI